MEAIETLHKKANEIKQKYGREKTLICGLMCDEILIRRHVQWNSTTMKFDGFIDAGRPIPDQDMLPVAKESLVFMISGVEEDFKIPIGYFFSNGLNADEKAALTNEALIRLHKVGVEIVSLTLDGLATNFAMCNILGADFKEDQAYFPHPVQANHKVYVILDPPHMLKLARTSISSKNLVDSDGGIIQWKYFKMLYEKQKELPFNLGNKITKEHIEFERKKMSVKLAAQILSNSVADTMEFFKDHDEEFKDVDATVKYIRIINDIFDIMNSTTSKKATGFKRTISESTSNEFFQRFDEAKTYLKGLMVEDDTTSIFSATIRTAFVGFYNNMVNFEKIYEDYVQSGKLGVLITHRFSQDLLESFFGSIRSMGGMFVYLIFHNTTLLKLFRLSGYNDNPTTQQFEAAYRKLLVHNDVVCSKKSNCIDPGTAILSVSSRKTKAKPKSQDTGGDESDEGVLDEALVLNFNAASQYVDDTHSHTLAYMANILENKIIRARPPRLIIKCEECIDAFIQNELMEDSFIRFKARTTNITQPCKSTYAICKFVDGFLKQYEGKEISFQNFLVEIMRKIPLQTLYTTTDFDSHAGKCHKYAFIKQIVILYMKSKSVQLARCYTSKSHGDVPMRNHYKKLIQELGQ